MTNREMQIYRTLVAIKNGEDTDRIPLTILQDLRDWGYISFIIPEGKNHPFVVFVQDKGNQFINTHAEEN